MKPFIASRMSHPTRFLLTSAFGLHPLLQYHPLKSVLLMLALALAPELAVRVCGQGTIAFNNLGTNNGLVVISRGSGGRYVPLNQDLNFALIAGPPGEPPALVHRWLLSDGSAKGINVAPGRFADPDGAGYKVPGVAPGAVAVVRVVAWGGNYEDWSAAEVAGAGSGNTPFFTMATGKAAAPPPGLMGMPELGVFGVAAPASPLSLEIFWSNGLPRLSISGRIGNSFLLEYAAAFSAANQWQTLMNETNWVLTNSPQFLTDSTAAAAPQRFYRVGPPAPPPPPSLIWITPGTFLMGSPTNEADRSSEEGPPTQVTLTYGFWMGRHQVTQIEYQAIVGANPSFFIGDPNRPVEKVSWNDATNYCSQLTGQERLAGRLPAGYSYRLPTEAEWEYAARAGTTTRFSYGDDPAYTNLADYAWHASNSGSQTHPVGQKQPNPWGLYDMYGNVWEWCLDWYGHYPGGSVTDPKGPSLSIAFHVLRGGSYASAGQYCRSASRFSELPENRRDTVGFRVVLAPVQP
jgi:formylglycine-generating enzyme required for sulfatase activity